jgi:hypothetical protein
MKIEDIFNMAIESKVADESLSSEDCLMTDYGNSTEDIIKFARLIESFVLNERESNDHSSN